jgi:hypothetical protein
MTQLVELESFGFIALRGRHYDADALAVAKAVAEMAGFRNRSAPSSFL